MDTEQFLWWLNGFLDLSPDGTFSLEQTELIKNQLTLVLNKIAENKEKAFSYSGINVSGSLPFSLGAVSGYSGYVPYSASIKPILTPTTT